MPQAFFDPSSIGLDDFVQDGAGFYYYGLPFQRGYGLRGSGIGNVFRHLLRFILPVVKGAGKTIGKEAVVTTARILDNIAQGAELKDTLVEEAKQGVKRLAQRQTGRGAKRRKRSTPKKKSGKKKSGKKSGKKKTGKKGKSRKAILGKRIIIPNSKLGFF